MYSTFDFFFLPELFIDKVVSHMKIELKQECDYIREAECSRVMRNFLKPYPNYYVPKVIDELSGTQIITSEFISGLTIDKCVDLDQETRNQIVTNFLVLLLTELFEFRYMQTDPNWANFLYNTDTKQVRRGPAVFFYEFFIHRILGMTLPKKKHLQDPKSSPVISTDFVVGLNIEIFHT